MEFPSPYEPVPWVKRHELGWIKAYVETVKLLIFRPKELFDRIAPGDSHGHGLLFMVIFSLPAALFSAIPLSFTIGHYAPQGSPKFLLIAGGVLGFFVLGILVNYLNAFLVNFSSRTVGGTGTFNTTFNANAYAAFITVFTFLPFIGFFLTLIWGLVLLVLLMRSTHELSPGKTILALLLLLGILLAVSFILIMTGVSLSIFTAFKASA